MRRLSGTDAMFLSMETPSWHQHVGALTILEPGDRPVSYEDVLRSVDARLPGAPKFRWRLKEMPLGLDRPVWIDDDDFDIRRHVRRVAVPSPGGAEEAAEVAGMVLSTQLDRSRPLWELWFLEGLVGGRLALVMKYHHCIMDGMSGSSLATVLMDLEPDATEPIFDPPTPEEQSAGPEPSTSEMVLRAASEAARGPARVGRFVAGGLQKLATVVGEIRGDDENRAILRCPQTPFNGPIGPRRAMSFSSVSLHDLRALKSHHDVKINDLVLTLVGGALRRYLLDLDALPDAPLVSAVPVSTRAEDDTTQDNKISMMFVALGTELDDPLERLAAIRRSATSAKSMQKAMGARQIQSIGEVASPLILSTAIRAMYRTKLLSRSPAGVSTLVANVPGPPIPLYMCGARIAGVFPSSVITEGMGVNVTVFSYEDRLDFGFHVDPDLVPDPWAIANGINASLAELMAASGLGDPSPVQDPFGRHLGGPTPPRRTKR